MLKNVAFIQIQKDATFNSDREKKNLIPNRSFRYYLQPIIIDNFSTHSYIVDIS